MISLPVSELKSHMSLVLFFNSSLNKNNHRKTHNFGEKNSIFELMTCEEVA